MMPDACDHATVLEPATCPTCGHATDIVIGLYDSADRLLGVRYFHTTGDAIGYCYVAAADEPEPAP